jgi:hypothetical protein
LLSVFFIEEIRSAQHGPTDKTYCPYQVGSNALEQQLEKLDKPH